MDIQIAIVDLGHGLFDQRGPVVPVDIIAKQRNSRVLHGNQPIYSYYLLDPTHKQFNIYETTLRLFLISILNFNLSLNMIDI